MLRAMGKAPVMESAVQSNDLRGFTVFKERHQVIFPPQKNYMIGPIRMSTASSVSMLTRQKLPIGQKELSRG